MNKTSISVGVLMSCVAAWALVTAYHVEPRSAAESGWTDTIPGQDYVSEIVTCCWDELDSTCCVQLFAGSHGAGGDYQVSILTYPGDIESGLDVV